MSLRTSNSAEQWDRVYEAFSNVSFVSYDFDTIRQSLIDYTQIYYAEVFNDIITSSEYIAMLELFAYVAEQLAYRVDMVSHENFITTAQRKQSILKLAKLISYKATRNIPVRGMVKMQTVVTSEHVIDSRGIDLSGVTVTWNDPNNTNWKEQFTLIMNRILTNRYGQPSKTYQVGDVVMDLYSLRNQPAGLRNGVFAYSALAGLDEYTMELVPADIDENGPFEREPDLASPMTMVYANDGIGDGSDYTGFLMYTKQGILTRIDVNVEDELPDRRIDFQPVNVNQTDVWVQKILNEQINQRWTQVETISEQNLVFNDDRSTRLKYEVDTLENDQISVVFGDGDFSDMPQGMFRFWMRQSANRSLVIQKADVQNQIFNFGYTSSLGNTENCTFTFGLTTTLQNGSATESIEHIRQAAPGSYYNQNRMVNGQDYNTYLLKDPSILRLKTVNRTFAGQPKYIDWNDASGMYENVKVFGDDLRMQYDVSINSQTTAMSGQSLIDTVVEPLLSDPGIINMMVHLSATDPNTRGVVAPPRRKFIEDNRGGLYKDQNGTNVTLIQGSTADGSLKEKTAIQGLIDRHWYGEPIRFVQDEETGRVMALIPDPDLFPKDDSRIYAADIPRTVDGINRFPPGDIGSGLQPIAEQDYFALRYNRYMKGIGNGSITTMLTAAIPGTTLDEVWTIEIAADGKTIDVRSNTRGVFPSGEVGQVYNLKVNESPDSIEFFKVTPGATPFEHGDAFVLDTVAASPFVSARVTWPWMMLGRDDSSSAVVNLLGWWEILGYSQLPSYAQGISSSQEKLFTNSTSTTELAENSWLIFIRKIRQQPTNNVIGYEVHSRDLSLTVSSENTKFWYNTGNLLIDSETQKRVFDNIKVLRSNLDSQGRPLGKSQRYDVVGPVVDAEGTTNFHQLAVVPSDMLQEDDSGNLMPDHLLQFEMFAAGSYAYFLIAAPNTVLTPQQIQAAKNATWSPGSFSDNSGVYGRYQAMPSTVSSTDAGLDFMWQHFTPYNNIVDPSVTNIHDSYIMTRGYYDNVISYVRGTSLIAPEPPTPLELRNSYGYLLRNKMLSDTVVLHPGKLRLLFGSLAEPQLRARFKVVKSMSGTLTNERLKEEILDVINTFFEIDNWDFGETFYATKLISLIHQRLPNDIASVVLVPVYSTNSFGSLFTVESGFDEILQTAAELSDIDVVEALTPAVIRQSR